jgi:hypothetical protein
VSERWYLTLHADGDEAEELAALPRETRARRAGRTYTPSALARPLPGSVGRPVRDLDAEERTA